MKEIKKIFWLCFFIFCFWLSSCHKDKPVQTPIDFGYNYSPNDTGHYVVYQVDSIWQDDISDTTITVRYQLKEKITSIFLDNSGRPTMRLERYYKIYHFNTQAYDTSWSAPRVWYANRTTTTLERVEENQRYIRLVFPVKQGATWNGNVYNTLGEKDYELTSVDQPDFVGTMHFDSVATVAQYFESNFVDYRNEYEKFAKGVGLIYKERDSISKQGLNFADTVGYRFTQKIISYEK